MGTRRFSFLFSFECHVTRYAEATPARQFCLVMLFAAFCLLPSCAGAGLASTGYPMGWALAPLAFLPGAWTSVAPCNGANSPNGRCFGGPTSSVCAPPFPCRDPYPDFVESDETMPTINHVNGGFRGELQNPFLTGTAQHPEVPLFRACSVFRVIFFGTPAMFGCVPVVQADRDAVPMLWFDSELAEFAAGCVLLCYPVHYDSSIAAPLPTSSCLPQPCLRLSTFRHIDTCPCSKNGCNAWSDPATPFEDTPGQAFYWSKTPPPDDGPTAHPSNCPAPTAVPGTTVYAGCVPPGQPGTCKPGPCTANEKPSGPLKQVIDAWHDQVAGHHNVSLLAAGLLLYVHPICALLQSANYDYTRANQPSCPVDCSGFTQVLL